ncbi:hypothetical protein JAAARDRAFT_71254 [Jaapia argillacea MUCL 33604]|uniref:Peptidase C14 caspase domain-containing protein n=1 Tax=Jaapia argillacea MUCL 33604 TaxID=933084 RepID=A0A067PNJ6_9AGAM|nr:hypothetical protein JAAARDRAFT_71254 [Jaapia argillacea MUCL 33604]
MLSTRPSHLSFDRDNLEREHHWALRGESPYPRFYHVSHSNRSSLYIPPEIAQLVGSPEPYTHHYVPASPEPILHHPLPIHEPSGQEQGGVPFPRFSHATQHDPGEEGPQQQQRSREVSDARSRVNSRGLKLSKPHPPPVQTHHVLSHSQPHYQPATHHPPPAPHYPPPAPIRRVDSRPPQPQPQSRPNAYTRPPLTSLGGVRKSLCIGINYTGQPDELNGCVNDARNVDQFLRERYGFDHSHMVLLVDESRNPREIPTKQNMLDAMKWLVSDAKWGDSLFIHYSGHGGQTRDSDGDEAYGYDGVIYPVDSDVNGFIPDDELNTILVRPLPAGCRLTALFDSCHSGSILDLVFGYDADGRPTGSFVSDKFRALKSSAAEVVCWSGSKDTGTSADTVEGGVAVGAMSFMFMKQLTQRPNISYAQLLQTVGRTLRKQYNQQPQISTSQRMDLNAPFKI